MARIGLTANFNMSGDYGKNELNTHVIAANISWYTQKTMDGIRVLPIDGFSSTPLRPKYSADSMSTIIHCNKYSILTKVTDESVASLTEC